uniref:Uncharacterized protein n=1 Tax=Meloidogyne enterolobii TaxID=390850 RepID=A0A6V7UGW9_MELEN|nr:unnamed protein product [Meloidogyne enterolobii]
MPENVPQQNDRPLEAPSLIELSAEIVANHAEHYLYTGKRDVTFSERAAEAFLTASSSSKISDSREASPHGHSRVAGLRDPAAEKALIQYQMISERPSTQSNIQGFLPIRPSEMVLHKICDRWRNTEHSQSPEEIDNALKPFYSGDMCPVSIVDLSGVQITDRILAALLINQRYSLTSLSLLSTKGITAAGICSLLYKTKIKLQHLHSLKLNSLDILRVPRYRQRYQPSVGCVALEKLVSNLNKSNRKMPLDLMEDNIRRLFSNDNVIRSESLDESQMDEYKLRAIMEHNEAQIESPPQFMHFCPALEHLYLLQGHTYSIEDETKSAFLVRIFSELPNLKTVDLSEWVIHDFLPLQKLHFLTTLVLYDVRDLETSIDTIATLTTLKSLDISQSDRTNGHYTRPVTSLHTLITSLPNLVSLDISGTNLTSASSDNDRPFIGRGIINSDIPALCFLRRPLKFLGIFNCDSSSQYANIPAERISGEHGEDQVLTAMEVYLERPKTMHTVLNESYQLYRFGTDLHRYVDALHLVLRALKMHLGNKDLQIAGSASMFYIIRHVKMNRDTKRRVILALLDGMESHLEEQVMVRNCCLSLCQFDIPQEILFNYGRVANLLVKVLETHNSDVLTQRIVVFLLNSMACHVEGEQKVEVGEIGAIEIILKQIERKLSANTCDDVMEVGWSFLWNITDETPSNCERFLKAHGLSLFSKCFSRFGSRYFELVRNMMGLIGNIAEVFELRNQLMTNAYLEIFCHLLDNLTESIEISYNSAGVLAHLVSDGDERWAESGVNIPREDVNRKIVKATEKWDLQARRFINYRSFKPIICLLPQWHSEGAQQWAVWALANLTTTDRKKYCRFIIDEGGLELLENLSVDARSTEAIKNLANIVLRNIDEWKRNIIEVNEEDLEMVDD